MLKRFDNKNYYEILGVSPEATRDEITKVYQDLYRIYHPDSEYYKDIINDPPRSEHTEIFKVIDSAYQTLVDEEARARYNDILFLNSHPNLQELSLKAGATGEWRRSQNQNSASSTATFERAFKLKSPKGENMKLQDNPEAWAQSLPSISEIIRKRNTSPMRILSVVILGAVCGGALGGLVYALVNSL
jgi:DnaJ-class molecular chaperone